MGLVFNVSFWFVNQEATSEASVTPSTCDINLPQSLPLDSGIPPTSLTMDPVDWSDVGHAVFIGFSALGGGLGQGQGCAGAPPGLPPGLRCPQEVPAGLAAAALAGLAVEVPLLHQAGVVQCQAIAERAALRELPVGAGRVMLGAWPLRGVQELRGGGVGQGTSAPLAVVIRFWSFRVKSRVLKPRQGDKAVSKTNELNSLYWQAPQSHTVLRLPNEDSLEHLAGHC